MDEARIGVEGYCLTVPDSPRRPRHAHQRRDAVFPGDDGAMREHATSLDDQPLANSKRILVSALGNAVNQGMTLGPSRNRLHSVGSSPVLVEPIVGELALKNLTAAGKVQVHALGPSGERTHVVSAVEAAGGLSFGLSAEHRAMHYEIVRE